MTLEQRITRAERMLKMFARSGRKYRKEFREKIDILIHTQMRDNEEWRARHRAMDEKINILINGHIELHELQKKTDEQLKRTDAQLEILGANHAKIDEALAQITANQKKTDEALDRLTANQKKTDEALDRLTENQGKTDEALRRFIDSLRKGRNGTKH